MAVNTIPVASDLILVMDKGIGASGQQLTQARTYKDLKTDADPNTIYTVAAALISLHSQDNLGIQRRDLIAIEPA
ncbi:MAG TPA: DUF1659 domain-containing protein [Syntrophomonadaceae bacterium]|nr:DUF1659 domain-containing protein [Syntrophomonadaceae bacterium]